MVPLWGDGGGGGFQRCVCWGGAVCSGKVIAEVKYCLDSLKSLTTRKRRSYFMQHGRILKIQSSVCLFVLEGRGQKEQTFSLDT